MLLCGLGALLSGNLTVEMLLADLPDRADRKIVYSAYFMAAFHLALLAHLLWRNTTTTPAPPEDG